MVLNKNDLSLKETAKLVFDYMYNKKKPMDILKAYSIVYSKYATKYSYDEIKDYLFHHDFSE